MNANEAIEKLGLEPLAGEGGYFKVLHRDEFGNAIYFLMTEDQFSAWHILNERETWVLIDGAPIELHLIKDSYAVHSLDRSTQNFQFSIEPQTWMAARTTGEWSLVLCFLAPAFSSMTLATKHDFQSWKEKYPNVRELLHG